MPQRTLHSPLGEITVSEETGAIVALDWGRGRDQADTPLLQRACKALQDYFDGADLPVDLPLSPAGTAFQRRVWDALRTIPHGETRTYGALARALGTAPRAIGGANAANPIPILIPCHRVVAEGGALGGYSGLDGPTTKRFLLDLEAQRRAAPRSRT